MIVGFFAPWAVEAAVLGLHLLLPARRVLGYARGDDGQPLHYRLNGLRVLAAVFALYAIAASAGIKHIRSPSAPGKITSTRSIARALFVTDLIGDSLSF